MRAFERSQEDAVTVTTTTGRFKVTKDGETIPLPDEEKVQRVGQAGCPGLLAEVRNALADIRSLWGLDAPKKTELFGKDGGAIEAKVTHVGEMSDDELMRIASRGSRGTTEASGDSA
jgi:hypothetical protein